MAVFPSFNLTKKGEELLNRSIGEGRVLTFTKFKLGDGVPAEDWRDLVNVQSSFKEFSVLETAIQADQVLRIRGYFDNKGFATDKQFKEIGVFVTLDGVAGEHLYSYTNAGDTGDIIPAESRGFYSRTLDVNNYIGYATNITFNIEQTRDNYDFNTENELKVATFLKKGDKIRLWGRLVLGDIETLNYIVTDEVTSLTLNNGLYCKLAGDNRAFAVENDLINLKGAVVGDVVEVLGFHAKGDGSHHKRIAKSADDGSGEQGQGGIWWCVVKNNGKYNYKSVNNTKILTKESDYGDVIDFDELENVEFSERLNRNKRNVLLRGGFDCIKSDKQEDIYESFVGDNKGKYFTGTVNSGLIHDIPMIKNRTEYNIVILGDSISTGQDFSTNVANVVTKHQNGINNKSDMSNWAHIFAMDLINKMRERNKTLKINVYNRSIGGRAYGNLPHSLSTLGASFVGRKGAEDSSITWAQSVKNLEPDLIILSMGMNEDAKGNAEGFYNHALPLIKSLRKYKNNMLQVAIMTTPNCKFDTHNDNSTFVNFSYQASKYMMANNQRVQSRVLNAYTIDVNRVSTIHRYGFDPVNMCISNRDTLIGTSMGGVDYPKNTKVSVPVDKLLMAKLKKYPLGGSLNFIINLKDDVFNSSNSGFRIFNSNDDTLFKIEFLTPGNGVKRFYVAFKEESKTTRSVTIDGKTTYEIRVDFMPEGTSLYVDGTLVLFSDLSVKTKHAPNVSPKGFDADVLMTRFLECQPARYMPNTLATEMWSNYSDEINYGQNRENGYGGGVNHPSTLGVVNVYNRAVSEFVNDLIQKMDNYNPETPKISTPSSYVNRWLYVGSTYKNNKVYDRITIKSLLGITDRRIYIENNKTTKTLSCKAVGFSSGTISFGYNDFGDVIDFYLKYNVILSSDDFVFIGDIEPVKFTDSSNYVETCTELPIVFESQLQQLDTPYYTLKMQQEGIYEDYVSYRDELHEYENSQTGDETMLLPVLQEPVIPESVKQFAEKYKLI